MSAITCHNVAKSYGGLGVISDFNLEIEDRSFVVLLGPSGCGKSTILRMIAGLEEISGGNISFEGKVVNDLEPSDRGVAMVFQSYALYPHMTVFDNIAFGLRRMSIPAGEIARRVTEAAGLVNLEPYLKRFPAQLSGGQQQRTAIARAIVKTPQVFLFDEPLSNLDAKLRNRMRTEIAKLHQKLNTTTVYVTHDQLEAMTLADKIIVLNNGRVEQQGAPREVYERPASLFVAGFIGSAPMNLIDAKTELAGGIWRALVGETPFVLPAGAFRLKEGGDVVIGFRPSDVARAAGEGENRIVGVVSFAEYNGDSILVSMAFQGDEVTALLPARQLVEVGDRLEVEVSSNLIHVFDKQTGLSLKI